MSATVINFPAPKGAEEPSTTIEYADLVPSEGWFPLTVCRKEARKWDWVALLVDVPPDQLKHCVCKTAWLFVHPNDYRPVRSHIAREVWVRIPGKHRNVDLAEDALQALMGTRH
jgi:hypothetical protein